MWRDIYRLILNPEMYISSENLRDVINRSGIVSREIIPESAIVNIDTLSDFALERANRHETELRATIEQLGDAARKRRAICSLLEHSAPMASSLGRWLQGLSYPGNFEEEIPLKALTLLADDIGAGQAEMSRTDGFRDLARMNGLPKAAGEPHDIIANRSLSDGAFRFPAILIALSRRSEKFEPEIAGLDYALRTVGLHPIWRVLANYMASPGWERLDLSRSQTAVLPATYTPTSLSRYILDRYSTNTDLRARVHEGIIWVINALADDMAEVITVAKLVADPASSMARLIQDRAGEAAIYHQSIDVEGKPLSQWFHEAKDDPFPLLDALSRSHLIRRGDPDRSILLSSLLRPNGPMFRIFEPEDIELIREWILSFNKLPHPTEAIAISETTPQNRQPIRGGNLELGSVPRDIREAYHLLQGRALAPRTRCFAADYARFWLRVSRQSIGTSGRSLPDRWEHGELRRWLLNVHASHDEAFQDRTKQSMANREELIDETLQLAPLTLIDGAWLQGFTEVSFASSRVGAPLFRIYWDELGNGDRSINHPKIYRDLLKSMGIVLPPTGASAFAYDPRFRRDSLSLPVFWLCLGKFPVSLRPEILGLNLAMELSGVGGSYRLASNLLRHHGFSTKFVDLHNTIDNVSSGHSAWAADAIDAHMIAAAQFVDQETEWERIRSGYEALAPVTRRPGELDFFKQQKRPRHIKTAQEPTYA